MYQCMPFTTMKKSGKIQTFSILRDSLRVKRYQQTHSYHSETVNYYFLLYFHHALWYSIYLMRSLAPLLHRSTKMHWLCNGKTAYSNRISISIAAFPIYNLWTHTNSNEIFGDEKHFDSRRWCVAKYWANLKDLCFEILTR